MCNIYMFYLQGWGLHYFPRQSVPMPDNLFREEILPSIQSKPPLVELEGISSFPVTCYVGEETDSYMASPSSQAVVESQGPPWASFSQLNIPSSLRHCSKDFCSRPFNSYVAVLWIRSSISMIQISRQKCSGLGRALRCTFVPLLFFSASCISSLLRQILVAWMLNFCLLNICKNKEVEVPFPASPGLCKSPLIFSLF